MMNLPPIASRPINNRIPLNFLIILSLLLQIFNKPINLILIFEFKTMAIPDRQQFVFGTALDQGRLGESFTILESAQNTCLEFLLLGRGEISGGQRQVLALMRDFYEKTWKWKKKDKGKVP
jgi:hypothetical protein